MRNKLFLMGMLALVFMLMVIGCDNGTTNEEPTSKSIVITGISDDRDWAYARIGIFPNLDDEFNMAVVMFVPIVNGRAAGEFKLVNGNHAWTGSGEYYVEVLLSMTESGHGQRVLYLYTNGGDNGLTFNFVHATTTIPFSAFKKTDEAE